MEKLKIVCIGEILWDSMPLGLFLGGAPFNVAYHLNKMGANVSFVSSVGDDDLGQEAVKRTAMNGMSTDLIQVDYQHKTGFVDVDIEAEGIPVYNIKKPAAWDFIQTTNTFTGAVQSADAIVFGTLAQRMETSKKTIQSIVDAPALKVLDLNLRTPYDDKSVVKKSLAIADFLKVNIEELERLKDWFNLPQKTERAVEALMDLFDLTCIGITLGGDGAIFYDGSRWVEDPGSEIEVLDTVGAGDAFLAALMYGYLQNLDLEENLSLANRLGAYVATCYGGTPDYSIQNLSGIDLLPLSQKSVSNTI